MTSTRTLVIIPTYNESENIGPIVRRVHAAEPDIHVLIVDDGSPDGTGDIADAMAGADDRVSVLHRTSKAGLGAAYQAGFDWAVRERFDFVVELDADGSHPPEVLPLMLRTAWSDPEIGGVIGSRWVPGGGVENWPLLRQLISRGGSLYARAMLGVPVKDVTAGYRVYPTRIFADLDLDSLDSKGYCFQIDMTRRVAATGRALVEVPIRFRERELGQSKMSGGIVAEAMWRVTAWGLRRWRDVLLGRARSSAAA